MATRNGGKDLDELILEDLRPKTREEKKIAAQSEFTGFIETFLNVEGRLPSAERVANEFPEKTQRQASLDLRAAAIRLEAKGYPIRKRDYLTPEQLAVANSILNLADKRSLTKKLQDFGVSPAKYGNWRKDQAFNNYLRERSETLLNDTIADVNLALMNAAQSGDMQAIKLFYEVTGRHTQNSKQEVNVQMMLVQVIEAVQNHVKDPAILQAIASDIQIATATQTLKGELA
jgi:hypothetical protein